MSTSCWSVEIPTQPDLGLSSMSTFAAADPDFTHINVDFEIVTIVVMATLKNSD